MTVWCDLYKVATAVSAWSKGVIGKLPEEFRPVASEVGGCAYVESTKSTGIVPVGVNPNGDVFVVTRSLTLAANWMCSFSVTYGARQ